ncbi:hypothetical protein QTV49_004876 [Vibrio vulnificus]|nr:hypothetical protein [Vibrio vulnificus]
MNNQSNKLLIESLSYSEDHWKQDISSLISTYWSITQAEANKILSFACEILKDRLPHHHIDTSLIPATSASGVTPLIPPSVHLTELALLFSKRVSDEMGLSPEPIGFEAALNSYLEGVMAIPSVSFESNFSDHILIRNIDNKEYWNSFSAQETAYINRELGLLPADWLCYLILWDYMVCTTTLKDNLATLVLEDKLDTKLVLGTTEDPEKTLTDRALDMCWYSGDVSCFKD